MKTKLLLSVLICAAFLSLVKAAPQPVPVTFAWSYTNDAPDVFKIYMTTDLVNPPGTWQLLATVPGTNQSTTIAMQPGKYFFYVTASNFWGESGPSNSASAPSQTTNVNTLNLRR